MTARQREAKQRQMAALRQIRIASGVWRHWVYVDALSISNSMLGKLVRDGALERRRKLTSGLAQYRLTCAGYEALTAAG